MHSGLHSKGMMTAAAMSVFLLGGAVAQADTAAESSVDYPGDISLIQDACKVVESEACLVSLYNAIADYSRDQMSRMCNTQGLDCSTLDILERNNLSLHWHACQDISGVYPGVPLLNQLSAPEYCLSTVSEFSDKYQLQYDRDTYDILRDYLERAKAAHRPT